MTSIIATNINSGGVPTTGLLCLKAIDVRANPASVSRSGGGFYVANWPFCGRLVAGALVGSLNVPNPATDSAPGHGYDVTITDTTTGLTTDLGPVYGIGGTSWSLDSYIPTVTVPTVSAFTFTSASGPPSGACTAPAFYSNSAASTIYTCVGGAWQLALGALTGGHLLGQLYPDHGMGDFINSSCTPWRGTINVMDCGAYADNTHDDTAAFNSCLSYSGVKCLAPVGTYKVNATTQLYIGQGAGLIGLGGPTVSGGVRLSGTLSAGCSIATNPADANPGLFSEISGITFVGNGTGDAGFCPLQSTTNGTTPPQDVNVHDNQFIGHTYCVNATALSYANFINNSCTGSNATGSIGFYLHPPSGAHTLELSMFRLNRIALYDKGASIQDGSRISFVENDFNNLLTVGVEFQSTTGKMFFDKNNLEFPSTNHAGPVAFLFDPSGSQVVAGVAISHSVIYLPGYVNTESAFKMTGTNYVSQVNLSDNILFKNGSVAPTAVMSLASVNPGTPGSNAFKNTGLNLGNTSGAIIEPAFGATAAYGTPSILGSNVTMTSAGPYYAGPYTPTLAAGHWFVTATITVEMIPAGGQTSPTQFSCRLSDGTQYSQGAATDISPISGVNRSQSLTINWLVTETAPAVITSYCQADYAGQVMLAYTLYGSLAASYITAIPQN